MAVYLLQVLFKGLNDRLDTKIKKAFDEAMFKNFRIANFRDQYHHRYQRYPK